MSRSAPCRVRQNTIVDPIVLIASAVAAARSVRSTRQKMWRAVVEVGALRADLVDDGIALNLVGELGHCRVERGGEHQYLAFLAGQLDDAANCREEPHVGHAVGLVDDDLVDVVECHETGLDQVLEPAGACHDELGGGVEGLALGAVAHPAVHRHDVMAA